MLSWYVFFDEMDCGNLHRKAGVSAYLYNEITVSKGLNLVFDIVITMSNSCDIILYSIVYKNLVHIVIINVR